MLVNSANLMNGSAEPDGYRGFGRVHLETVLPMSGEGDMGLFVADSSTTSLEGFDEHKYLFDLDTSTGMDVRATLAWIDPPASPMAQVLLMHDLNLKVESPNGTVYTMWSDHEDDRNVIERVIVPGDQIAGDGQWVVSVSSLDVTDDSQPYSLVVTGPFERVESVTDGNSDADESSSASRTHGRTLLWVLIATVSSTIAVTG